MTEQAVLYCLGAQKSATSWLFDQISKADGCYGCPPKEMSYWATIRVPHVNLPVLNHRQRLGLSPNPGLRGAFVEKFSASQRALVSLEKELRNVFLADPFDHQRYLAYLGYQRVAERWLMDFSPIYARLTAPTYREMLDTTPNSKFIFVMRDPVDRLWSGIKQRYRFHISANQTSLPSLQKAFALALTDPHNLDLYFSSYERTLTQMFTVLPRERVKLIYYEDMFDPERAPDISEDLRAFLDIDSLTLRRDAVVYASATQVKDAPLPEDAAQARALLAPTYDAVRTEMGGRLPEAWEAQLAAASA